MPEIKMISIDDERYPERLRNIYDPPKQLYYRGVFPQIDKLAVIGVVGTRKCTAYGAKYAQQICHELSNKGIIVATGLALGIDSFAAKGAVSAGKPLIGVVGCGVDIVYPPSNKKLFDEVLKVGAIVSEYPPGTPAMPYHFPARNRIISGLSVGVAVIEAPEKSGALITSTYALEQGRDVFVLPANADMKSSIGSNRLLRDGAIPFFCADDIIDEYSDIFNITSNLSKSKIKDNKKLDDNSKVEYINDDSFAANQNEDLDDDQSTVLQTLGTGKLHIDEITLSTGFTAQRVLTALTMLEISGYVDNFSNYFSLRERI